MRSLALLLYFQLDAREARRSDLARAPTVSTTAEFCPTAAGMRRTYVNIGQRRLAGGSDRLAWDQMRTEASEVGRCETHFFRRLFRSTGGFPRRGSSLA